MTTLQRILIIIGSLSLATAILFAAYGFHVLGDVLTQQQKQAWSLAFQMQSFHALGLFLVAFLTGHLNRSLPLLKLAALGMMVGTLLFSGNIYARALGGPEVLVAITPYGGGMFLISWVLITVAAWRSRV